MTLFQELFHESDSLVAVYPKLYITRAPARDLAVRPPGQLFESFVDFDISIIFRGRQGDRKRAMSKRFGELFF